MRKTNDWATRLLMESYTTPPTHFLTLTYDEMALPRKADGSPTFDRQHLKQICRELTRRQPTRYYGIAEHGTDTERPHYHLITFGCDIKTIDEVLQRYWAPRGIYTIGDHMNARLMYVALFHVLTGHKYSDEFTVMSRNPGIGAYFLVNYRKGDSKRLCKEYRDPAYIAALFRHGEGTVNLGGESRLLPRYMIDQLDDSIREDIKDARLRHVYERFGKFVGLDITSRRDYQNVMEYLPEQQLQEWNALLKEVNRRKTNDFVKRHRKARHVDTVI